MAFIISIYVFHGGQLRKQLKFTAEMAIECMGSRLFLTQNSFTHMNAIVRAYIVARLVLVAAILMQFKNEMGFEVRIKPLKLRVHPALQ